MSNRLGMFRMLVLVMAVGTAMQVSAQWLQWGRNPQHTGYVPEVEGQPLEQASMLLTIDNTVQPPAGINIHYASPLIDNANNIFMTQKELDMDGVIHRRVVKLDNLGTVLCSFETDYVPPPAQWEPVFHPILANGILYVPGARATLHQVSREDCTEIGPPISSYEIPDDETIRQQLLLTVFIAGVPATDDSGNIFFTMLARSGAPLGLVSQLVRVDAVSGMVTSVNFPDLLPNDPTQRPALNAAPALAPDGTIYVGSVREGNPNAGLLLALNPDLTLKWQASMSQDPGRIARVIDVSSSTPVVGPDGRVFYGGHSFNHVSAGYLYSFSPDGLFLGSFDFGWDTTPAVYPDPDGVPAHYHLVEKYNFYDVDFYRMVSINPDTMSMECGYVLPTNEWCINAPAIDRNGTVYSNGEDGNLYAIRGLIPAPNGTCNVTATQILLERPRSAPYTPLALGPDGTIYTLNNGRLFAVGIAQ